MSEASITASERISTWEGAIYVQFGMYRPGRGSLMRFVNWPFDQAAGGHDRQVFRAVESLRDDARRQPD